MIVGGYNRSSRIVDLVNLGQDIKASGFRVFKYSAQLQALGWLRLMPTYFFAKPNTTLFFADPINHVFDSDSSTMSS